MTSDNTSDSTPTAAVRRSPGMLKALRARLTSVAGRLAIAVISRLIVDWVCDHFGDLG